MTDDLAQWLTQIWDEDEARVRAAIADDGGQDGGFEDDFARLTGHGPLGVLPRFGEAAARMIVWQTPRRDATWTDSRPTGRSSRCITPTGGTSLATRSAMPARR